ncbi:collagen alpha-1(III) chain-like [Penaeus chinensis]|uniref:collagen alpha-1(III) chain-like n=1 Tax=Penaeus chinensis TaxID=139456 RepID=UPI001FB7C7FC|nr:collagen alpha-1(III) chain-like [Penaeus chinensis]XP_047488201.1 collagen alpha-1(III) chain-like [Penaeus chinensis]XP_047488202.1 collagen alpha-1(III) chain-like [Penaeus chinensis]
MNERRLGLLVFALALPLALPEDVSGVRGKRQAPVGVLNPPIPTSVGHYLGGDKPVDNCPRDEVTLPDGRCYPLLTQGPCAITEYVLLNPATNKGYCAPRLCAPDRIFIFSDQLCHDPRSTSLCPPGRQLYQTSFGTPVCQCPDGTYEGDDDLDDDVCEPLLGQTLLCQPGQVFWFRDFSQPPECLPDPCGGDNLNRGPNDLPFVPAADGKCYQLGSNPSVCPAQTWYSIALERLQGVCATLQDAGYEVFDAATLAALTELYGPFIPRDTTAPIPVAQGAPGTQGAQGAPGVLRSPGVSGVPGAPGTQGALGTQGIQNTPGAQGVQGAPSLPAGAPRPTQLGGQAQVPSQSLNVINGNGALGGRQPGSGLTGQGRLDFQSGSQAGAGSPSPTGQKIAAGGQLSTAGPGSFGAPSAVGVQRPQAPFGGSQASFRPSSGTAGQPSFSPVQSGQTAFQPSGIHSAGARPSVSRPAATESQSGFSHLVGRPASPGFQKPSVHSVGSGARPSSVQPATQAGHFQGPVRATISPQSWVDGHIAGASVPPQRASVTSAPLSYTSQPGRDTSTGNFPFGGQPGESQGAFPSSFSDEAFGGVQGFSSGDGFSDFSSTQDDTSFELFDMPDSRAFLGYSYEEPQGRPFNPSLGVRRAKLLAQVSLLGDDVNYGQLSSLQAPAGHKLHNFFNGVRQIVSNLPNSTGTHHRSRRSPLPHATPGNVLETRLVGCRAGAQRDINAKCRDTVLPPQTPASRPSRAAPPVPPRMSCPSGQAYNLQRMCEPIGSAVSSINAFNLG